MGKGTKIILRLSIFFGILAAVYFYWWKPNAEQNMITAASKGDIPSVEFLLNTGIDVNAKTEEGWSAIHYAASWCNYSMAEFLVKNGANVNLRGKGGETPLHRTASYKCEKTMVVNYLINQGADLNAKSDRGYTPLHNAAEGIMPKGRSKFPIITTLVNSGADLTVTNHEDQTPYDLAVFFKDYSNASWLKPKEIISFSGKITGVDRGKDGKTVELTNEMTGEKLYATISIPNLGHNTGFDFNDIKLGRKLEVKGQPFLLGKNRHLTATHAKQID